MVSSGRAKAVRGSTERLLLAGLAFAVLAVLVGSSGAEAATGVWLTIVRPTGVTLRPGDIVTGDDYRLVVDVSSSSSLKDVELTVRGRNVAPSMPFLAPQVESFRAGPWKETDNITSYALSARWNTTRGDPKQGDPPLPNGVYDVTVTVIPWVGEATTKSIDDLKVDNPPSRPRITSATVQDNLPVIEWDGGPARDEGYEIQRLEECHDRSAKPQECGHFVTIDSVGPLGLSEYRDTHVTKGTGYRYQIVAWRPSVVSGKTRSLSPPTDWLHVTDQPGNGLDSSLENMLQVNPRAGKSFFLVAAQADKLRASNARPNPSATTSDGITPEANTRPDAPAGTTDARGGPIQPRIPTASPGSSTLSSAQQLDHGEPSPGETVRSPSARKLPASDRSTGGGWALAILGIVLVTGASAGTVLWRRRGR